jgi:hypothetical protein
MKKLSHHIHTAAHEVHLSEAERVRMRNTLTAYMAMKPVRSAHTTYRALSFLEIVFSPRLVTLVLIGAILSSSAGVSYAAESALPGDTLYSVKTRIIEPVRGALAATPSAKRAWAIQVADERAKEAATLAAENKLDASTQAQIEESFRSHAHIASAALEQNTTVNPTESSTEAARFEARLSEYERVIVALAPEPEKHERFAQALREERARVALLRDKAEEKADKEPEEELEKNARLTLAVVEERVRTASHAFATSTAEKIALQINTASDTIATARSSEKDSSATQAARETMRKTVRDAEKIAVFAEASAAIHARTGLVITQERTSRTRGKKPTPPETTHLARNTEAPEAVPMAMMAPATESLSLETSSRMLVDTPATTSASTTPKIQKDKKEDRKGRDAAEGTEAYEQKEEDTRESEKRILILPAPEPDDD